MATTGTDPDVVVPIQAGTALVLLILILGMNLGAIVLRDKTAKKLKH